VRPVDSRLTWLAGGILLWAAIILIKLVSLQVVHHPSYLRMARQQQEKQVDIHAPRGSIFDRHGQLLAMSVPMESVFVNPRQVPDLSLASDLLGRVLQLNRKQLQERLEAAKERGRGFLWVKRRVTPEEAARLKSFRLEWIGFQQESQRHYPKGGIAAHVLGSVDHGERGNAGVERTLDRELHGASGKGRLLTDVRRRGIDWQLSAAPQEGADLMLSIDERIQFAAERDLAAAVDGSRARSGSVVVMNPHNGEVLALASYPGYDPNRAPRKGDDPQSRFNHAASVPFEPGSVFKVFTLAAALETTDLRPETPINCGNGSITLFGRVIREASRGYGWIPMTAVLAKSSNVGAIQIGMRVGQRRLHEYVRQFGFGTGTGSPLPAESSGLVRRLDRWGKTSLGSVAMGHEVSTTTLQLAQACSVIANGGMLIKPRLIVKKGGAAVPQAAGRRVIRPETAIQMRRMMEEVVLHGTGTRARLEGYSSGGKTGSAQIFDAAAKRYTHTYNASFMGFAPVGNPAVVVVVTLNGTSGGAAGYGGAVAAPVFRAVAQEALRVLDVPKDLPEKLPPAETAAPIEDLAIAELGPPAPVAEIAEAAAAGLDDGDFPRVPNFAGKTKRAVIEEASTLGLPVMVDGNGLARLQFPAPGTALEPGEKVRVQFAR
jgi:cell division protein FtsI (penicillin-binding protein 3)